MHGHRKGPSVALDVDQHVVTPLGIRDNERLQLRRTPEEHIEVSCAALEPFKPLAASSVSDAARASLPSRLDKIPPTETDTSMFTHNTG